MNPNIYPINDPNIGYIGSIYGAPGSVVGNSGLELSPTRTEPTRVQAATSLEIALSAGATAPDMADGRLMDALGISKMKTVSYLWTGFLGIS